MILALLLASWVAPQEAPPGGDFVDWIERGGGLIEAFEAGVGELLLEGVATPSGMSDEPRPTVLVTSFDRSVAEAWVDAFVEHLRADESARAALESVRVIVLPGIARRGGDATRFGVDFPVGWLPGTLRDGAAEVPLADEETRALAQWMLGRDELVGVLALDGPDRGKAQAGRALASVTPYLRPVVGELDGGWLDYAREGLGLWTLTALDGVSPAESASGLGAFCELLPRIEVELVEATQLAVGLWQVDLLLENRGVLPTAVGTAPPLLIDVTGVELVAVARREGDRGSFRVGRVRRGALVEPILGALARRTLRLVVELEGESGQLSISASSPRLGHVALDVPLLLVRD